LLFICLRVDVYIAKEKQQEFKDPDTDLTSDNQIKEIASFSRSRSPKNTKKPEPTQEKTTEPGTPSTTFSFDPFWTTLLTFRIGELRYTFSRMNVASNMTTHVNSPLPYAHNAILKVTIEESTTITKTPSTH